MAKRVTDADIIKMNELYLVHQNKQKSLDRQVLALQQYQNI